MPFLTGILGDASPFEESSLLARDDCPLAFSAVIALAICLVLGACLVRDLYNDSTSVITEMQSNLKMVLWAIRSFVGRACSRDGVRCAGQFVWRCAVAGARKSGLYALVSWAWPGDDIVCAFLLLAPFLLFACYVNFGRDVYAYLEGLYDGFDNLSGVRLSQCDLFDKGYVTFGEHRYPDARRRELYCDGELAGMNMQDVWGSVTERLLYMWYTLLLAVFYFVIGSACLYAFVGWLARNLGVAQGKRQSVQGITGHVGGQAKVEAQREVGGHSGSTGATDYRDIIAQLDGKIRDLEGRNAEVSARAENLQRQVDVSTSDLQALQRKHATLEDNYRVASSRQRDRTQDSGWPVQTTPEQTYRLLQMANQKIGNHLQTIKLAEDRYDNLRALTGIICQAELQSLLLPVDEFEKEVRNDGYNNPDRLETIQGRMLPYLLREAARGAASIRKTIDDEERTEVAALKSDLESARNQISSLESELASRLQERASLDDSAKKVTAELDAMSHQHASVVEALEAQRSENAALASVLEAERDNHKLAVAALQGLHDEALVAVSSRDAELEKELQEAKTVTETVAAGSDLDEAANTDKADEVREEIAGETPDLILDLSREFEKLAIRPAIPVVRAADFPGITQWQAEALKRAKEAAWVLKERVEAAESCVRNTQNAAASNIAELQKQVSDAATREEALSAELSNLRGQQMEKDAELQEQQGEAQAQRDVMVQEGNALVQQNQRYRESIISLESEIRLLQAEVENMRQQAQGGQTSAREESYKRIVALQADNNELTRKLNLARQTSMDEQTQTQMEQLRTRVQALRQIEQALTSDKVTLTNRVTHLEGELRRATISRTNQANTNPALVGSRPPPRVNPLSGKVKSLEKELEQVKADLATKERLLEEATRSQRELAAKEGLRGRKRGVSEADEGGQDEGSSAPKRPRGPPSETEEDTAA